MDWLLGLFLQRSASLSVSVEVVLVKLFIDRFAAMLAKLLLSSPLCSFHLLALLVESLKMLGLSLVWRLEVFNEVYFYLSSGSVCKSVFEDLFI